MFSVTNSRDSWIPLRPHMVFESTLIPMLQIFLWFLHKSKYPSCIMTSFITSALMQLLQPWWIQGSLWSQQEWYDKQPRYCLSKKQPPRYWKDYWPISYVTMTLVPNHDHDDNFTTYLNNFPRSSTRRASNLDPEWASYFVYLKPCQNKYYLGQVYYVNNIVHSHK